MNTLQDTRLTDYIVRITTPTLVAFSTLLVAWGIYVSGFSPSVSNVLNIIVLRTTPTVAVAMTGALLVLLVSQLVAKKKGADTTHRNATIFYASLVILISLTFFTISSILILA